jgi:hypothetical protein
MSSKPADIPFNVRRVGRLDIPDHERVVVSGERLESQDFSGRHLLQFSAEGARLERCAFDGAVIESASFSAGRVVSEYVGCSFDEAKIHMGPGGYARFVGCTFGAARRSFAISRVIRWHEPSLLSFMGLCRFNVVRRRSTTRHVTCSYVASFCVDGAGWR